MTNDKINSEKYDNLVNLLLKLVSVIRAKNKEIKGLILKTNILISSVSIRKNEEEFSALNNYRKSLNRKIFNGKENSIYTICNFVLIELENLTNCNLGGLTYEEVRNKVLNSSKKCVEQDEYNILIQKINTWNKAIQNLSTDGNEDKIQYFEERIVYSNLIDRINKLEKSFVKKMNGVKDDKIKRKYESILANINHLKFSHNSQLLSLSKQDDVKMKTQELKLYNNRIREKISEIENDIKVCVNSYLSFQKNMKEIEMRSEKAFSKFRELEAKINDLVSIQDNFPKQVRGEIKSLFRRFCMESAEIYNIYSLLWNLQGTIDNVKVTMLEAKCSIIYRKYAPSIEELYKLHDELSMRKNSNKKEVQEASIKTKILNFIKNYMNQGTIEFEDIGVCKLKKPTGEIRQHLNHLYTTIFNMNDDSFNIDDFERCQKFLLEITSDKYYFDNTQAIIQVIEEYKLELIEKKMIHK